MSLDTSTLHSRRALLMTGVGGFAALVASALGRPNPVQAGVDGDVVLGATNAATTTTTSLSNQTNANAVFAATSTHIAGVAASGSGNGVEGRSFGGNGVVGSSTNGGGVLGTSTALYGVSGASDTGNGVIGKSTSGNAVSASSTSGSGVSASSTSGTGVSASSTSGTGVSGNGAKGVSGTSAGGIGVYAESTTGKALQVVGPALFSRSGRASVAAGRSHVDVNVTGGLDRAASVLAVLQSHRNGVYVAGVRKNYPSSGQARIFLNKVASRSSSTVVAWFVIG